MHLRFRIGLYLGGLCKMIADIPSNYGRFTIRSYFLHLQQAAKFTDGFAADKLYPENASIAQQEKVDNELSFAVVQGLLSKNGHYKIINALPENETFFKELLSKEIPDWDESRQSISLPAYKVILAKFPTFQVLMELFNERNNLTVKDIETLLRRLDTKKSTDFYYKKAAKKLPLFLAVAGLVAKKDKMWRSVGRKPNLQKKLGEPEIEKQEPKPINNRIKSVFVKNMITGKLEEIFIEEEKYKEIILKNFI